MIEAFDRLKTALSNRYAIDREIGEGGMAIVYLAEDLRHGRQVALKILRPTLAATLGTDRFVREIGIAARLTHPHILPVHDSGVADGVFYYVMPYIEGESLQERLERETQLPLDDALRIVRDVADALTYAHDQQVLHRDVKPANILLSGGHAVVTDFGIARAIEYADHKVITEAGAVIGTPAYMSPEQASGEEELDRRSDIYSLGCVFYEMLAGKPPFEGPTPLSTLLQSIGDPVPPLRHLRPTIPGHVDATCARALAKLPADRFATAAAFVEALGTPGAVAPVSEPTSIAVLPFVNMSADPEAEYLCDGITEEIIIALSQLDDFRVAARTSSFSFKGKSPSLAELREKLNVKTVLSGSVRKAGNRLRVVAQLVGVDDGYHLWSERYDREMQDVFAIQDDIAGAIVATSKGHVAAEKYAGSVRRYTANVEAYELYLKGRYVEKTRRRSGFTKGIEYFDRAIERDPEYALAYAGLADTYSLLAWYRFLPPREAFGKARSAAQRALEIDDTLPEAHTSVGVVQFYHDWDWRGAERAYRRALELNPNDATALHSYAECLAAQGCLEESRALIQRAHQLEPLSLTVNAGLGWIHFFSRNFDLAIEHLEKTIDMDPEYVFLNWFLGQAYLMAGHEERSIASFREGFERSAEHPGMAAYLAYAYARSGRPEEAKRIFRDLTQQAKRTYVPADYFCVVCMGLGHTDEAFDWLIKATEERALHMAFLGVDPLFDSLRSDQRFTRVLETIGLKTG